MSRPTPVLLHGWGFGAAVWDPLLPLIADLDPLVPDLPGHGGAPGGPELADAAATAGWLLERLPRDLHEPVWVGWSLGALVALALATRWQGPQRLVLVCGTPRFTAGPSWPCALDPETLAGFAKELERDRVALERRFAALCAQGSGNASVLRRRIVAQMRERPSSLPALRAGLEALARLDLRAALQGCAGPVSAWLGADDALVPAGVGEALAALRPDAELRVVPGGHAAWLDDAPGFAGFLREASA